MNTDCNILFTDMDGTLLLSDSTVSPRMQEALHRMTAAGHKLVLSSGRPLDSMLEVASHAGLLYPGTLIIAQNGALVFDYDAKTPLLERRVPLPVCREIIAAARARSLHIQSYTETHILSEQDSPEVQYYRRRIHLPLCLVEDLADALHKEPYKLLSISLDRRSVIEDLQQEIAVRFGDLVTPMFSNDYYLEFFHQKAGKGNAVRFVCDYFGVPLSHAIAAGDAQNDLSMLAAAGTGVAMANAAPVVKEQADFITQADNDHDGLLEAIERFFPF